jgi:hypothetical protein
MCRKLRNLLCMLLPLVFPEMSASFTSCIVEIIPVYLVVILLSVEFGSLYR